MLFLALSVSCTSFGDREGAVIELPKMPVYGHVHMAKTGGTSINGILANQFERVCGHKGYSYDFFQSNRRHKTAGVGAAHDFVHKHWNEWSADRQRVPLPIMDEIGYEDCDWISLEESWSAWGPRHGVTELHVPCRDPIEHILSECNHLQKALNRSSRNALLQSAARCAFSMERFSYKLLDKYSVKCYSFEHQFNATRGYLHWISDRLQKKRAHEPYNYVATNRKREKVHLTEGEKQILTSELLRHDYYQFCRACMNSSDVLE